MARLQRRRFSQPSEVRLVPKGHVDIVELDDVVVGRMWFEPGWKWSRDVGPIAGTATCQYRHVGVVQTGVLVVEMDDGTTLRLEPGDVFEIPPGHDSEVVSDEPWVAIDFAGVRTFARPAEERGERILASILFTDIVDSTATAERIGDAAWKSLVARHNEVILGELDRYRGRMVKTTGDGILALFDGAERAVRCAAAICLAAREMGLAIRAGIHTGEVELVAGDVRGVAVHVAARILSLAGPSQVVVSATTQDLLAGSGLEFEDGGRHELKGLTGMRQVFRLSVPPARA
jgi:class 3 adenylate cyclase